MTSTLHDPEYRAFVERLITLRKEAGLTQAALAAKIGKPQSFVSKSERYERRIDPAEFCLLVAAMGRDPVVEFAVVVPTHRLSPSPM